MKLIMKVKITVDICMVIVLLFLMSYSMAGDVVHEWLGIGMFILFILHHALNIKWWSSIIKGRYTMFLIIQTVLVITVLLAMAGSMASGVILSRHVLAFLPINTSMSFARKLHMACAYWEFILMSLHLGIHWCIITGIIKKFVKAQPQALTWMLRIIAIITASYGIYAFIKREIPDYMFMKIQFVFFNFEELLLLFILDYLAVMRLFVFIGHYASTIIKKINSH